MAKLTISSGRRGRPLSIDPSKELNDLIYKTLPKTRRRLAEIREATSGSRDERILGTEQTLPENIQAAIDVLLDLEEGASVDYDTLKELKANIRNAQMLASPQERVYGRALEERFTTDYLEALEYTSRNASDLVKETNKRVVERLKSLTPQQRQKYFTSRKYQDPRTMTGEYEKVRAWASKKMGRELSMQEAWAVVRDDESGSFSAIVAAGKSNFVGSYENEEEEF